jgi:hypothetical protein
MSRSGQVQGREPVSLEAGSASLYVSDVKSVPDDISPIIGDAIHNLRTALDYLMWQLVESGGGVPDKR